MGGGRGFDEDGERTSADRLVRAASGPPSSQSRQTEEWYWSEGLRHLFDSKEAAGRQGKDEDGERTSADRLVRAASGTPGSGRRGDIRLADERQGDIPPTEAEINAPLSESESDELGKPLVLSKDGTTIFGNVDAESGLTEAPIKLSLGENFVDEKGNNHGYGLLHIEAGHGKQIRKAGYNSVEEFVEEVARNYTDVREGAIIANNQTYLLEVSDEHNNTLFIQLSRDGSYWNVNSAGIFKKKYSRRKPKVYTVPAVGEGKSTDTSKVDSGQNKGATAPAGNSPKTSDGKVNDFATDKQASGAESSGNLEPMPIDKDGEANARTP